MKIGLAMVLVPSALAATLAARDAPTAVTQKLYLVQCSKCHGPDEIGTDKKDYFVRAAYDLPGGVSVGAFSLTGDKVLTAPTRTQQYARTGVDFQVGSHGFTANALWYQANEDLATTLVEQKNKAWYFQTLYVTPTKLPVVPVFRYESVESSNGTAATNSVALALVAYIRANINVSADFIKQVKVPGTAAKTNRFSVMFMVGM